MDLSDIRADLDLSVRAIGEEAPAAILEARFAFETHWGAHAAAALAPLHALAQQH
jgi:hypothetical protein